VNIQNLNKNSFGLVCFHLTICEYEWHRIRCSRVTSVFNKYHYTKQKSFELVVSENKISKDLANLKQKSPVVTMFYAES
jgi:hypothetical protein